MTVLAAGCGSPPKPFVKHTLASNILAQPRGKVGLVTTSFASPMRTALRALGIQYGTISLAQVATADLSVYPIVILDEGALDGEKTSAAYEGLVSNVSKYGQTLLILRQSTEVIRKIGGFSQFRLVARDVEYRIVLATPRSGDPVMFRPNPVTRADLDSLSTGTHQLAMGGKEARAIISANLVSPDSSAALLWQPIARGQIWYLSVPIAARAADGRDAERRLLCNLLSDK